MRIKVSKRAAKSFQSIKDFVKEKWGDLISDAFEQKTINFLDLLEEFPEIGTLEIPERKVYGFQLTKQTKVFYRVKSDIIIIIVFFDVRQHPQRKPS